MTTATAAPLSARPGIGRGRALEDREHGLELAAQVLHGLRRERPARLRLELARAAVLLDLLASALDRVLLRVRSEEHTSELQSRPHLVCRPLPEKKQKHVTCAP